MHYLLDTNTCVDYLTGRYPEVAERIRGAAPDDLCTSSVVMAELRYGADKSQRRRANHDRVDVFLESIHCLDFDAQAAVTFGRVRSALERRGQPIGPYDMLIASHALSRGLVLVSDNLREFHRIGELRVESWRLRLT